MAGKIIGLFFGSFNPIHNGHLMIANYLAESGELDQVWFVISPMNPFKTEQKLLPHYHRRELLTLAIRDYPRFRISEAEFHLPKPSYTIDTLNFLKKEHPENQFILIMGSDQMPDFHRWKNSAEILENYRILVYPRPGEEREAKGVTRETEDREAECVKRETEEREAKGVKRETEEREAEEREAKGVKRETEERETEEREAKGVKRETEDGDRDNFGFSCHASRFTHHDFPNHPSIELLESAPMMEISSTFIRQAIKEGKDLRFFMPELTWQYLKEMHFYEK